MARGAKRAAVDVGPVEGPWELPEGWRWERLGKLCEPSQYGWTTRASATGSVKFLRTTDISSGRVNWQTVPFCEVPPPRVEKYVLRTGDILVSRAGSVGKSFLIEDDAEAVFASYLIRYRPRIVPKFVHYYMQTATYWAQIADDTAGIAIPNVNASKLDALLVPVPPSEVQSAIVARIDELFAEIDEGEQGLAAAREAVGTYQQSHLRAAVAGQLTSDWRQENAPSVSGEMLRTELLEARRKRWLSESRNDRKKYSDPVKPTQTALPVLPAGWCWVSLDELAWSAQYGTSMKCAVDGAGEPVLRIPNLRGGSIELNDLKYANLPLGFPPDDGVHPGDLLVVRTNGSDDLIGRTAMTTEALDVPTYFASYLIRYRLIGDQSLWSWIRLFTESALFRSHVKSSIGSSAGQYNLSMGKLDAFPIAIPPPDERTAILHAVAVGAAPAVPNVDTGSLRQSILAAAFRGDLVA